jgi:hypothetical protein
MKKELDYWTLAQAIAWVCTRDEIVAGGLAEPQSLRALQTQLHKYRSGEKLHRRVRLNGPAEYSAEPTKQDNFACSNAALARLCLAILGGTILTIARDTANGSWGRIAPGERIDLEFRMCPDDRVRPYGFWSKSTGQCRWIEPLLSKLDMQRLWPVPVQSPTNRTAKQVRDRLAEVMAHSKLTKEDARKKCESIAGFSVRGFDRAWREFPGGQKFGPGEHGKRRKPRG